MVCALCGLSLVAFDEVYVALWGGDRDLFFVKADFDAFLEFNGLNLSGLVIDGNSRMRGESADLSGRALLLL